MTGILSKIFLFLTLVSVSLQPGNAFAQAPGKGLSAYKAAKKLSELNLENLPSWSQSHYLQSFDEIRDKKFLMYQGKERRIPWLYTRDGCHVRSTHFIFESERLGLVKPKKIFIFGALEIRGAIVPNGSVKPWFHVAPIIQVGGEPMVLDPSVDFSGPLPLEKWITFVAEDRSQTIFAICESDTYFPSSSCSSPGPIDLEKLDQETQLYLKFEQNIISNLGLKID